MNQKKQICLLMLGAILVSTSLASCTKDNSSSSNVISSATPEVVSSTAPVVSKFTVTFNANYEGGTNSVVSVEKNQTVAKPTNPTRTGYTFANWYTESACTTTFDFATPITADLTLYAGWTAFDSATEIMVTFYYNYAGSPNSGIYQTSVIKKKRKIERPTAPTYAEHYFNHWSSDEAGTTAFDFDTILSANTSLYAQWQKQYVFEAEYTDFTGKMGMGYSGNAEEENMISKDTSNAGASNGYYVSWLYYNGAFLEFDLESSAAVTDLTVIARFSVEFYDMSLDSSSYEITVNGTALSGYSLNLSGAYAVGTSGMRPFADYSIAVNASLAAGSNVIKLITNNSHSHGGTMQADAPVVDCIKLATNSATLSWSAGFPKTSNIA